MLTSDRLEFVGDLAAEYARLALDDTDRRAMLRVCDVAVAFNALEMAYFCQQVVSHCPDVHIASMILVAFTNRLAWTP